MFPGLHLVLILFQIIARYFKPALWADGNANGRYLATGRYRDGGWSGMGPALFAYRPWVDGSGTPAPSGPYLEETTLLLYENSMNTDKGGIHFDALDLWCGHCPHLKSWLIHLCSLL